MTRDYVFGLFEKGKSPRALPRKKKKKKEEMGANFFDQKEPPETNATNAKMLFTQLFQVHGRIQ